MPPTTKRKRHKTTLINNELSLVNLGPKPRKNGKFTKNPMNSIESRRSSNLSKKSKHNSPKVRKSPAR